MKLGIALSGGGVRGLAHAGVLKALEENNIKISAIGGTSSGGIVAALYAMGFSPYYIYIISKKYAKDLIKTNNNTIIYEAINFMLGKKVKAKGLHNSQNLEEAINYIALKKGIKEIQDIQMPLIIPTVDIKDSKKYLFTSKIPENSNENYITDIKIGTAVRASCNFPAVFTPCEYNNHMFMDGGILDNIPALEIKKFNIDKIISVKFSSDAIDSNSNVMDIVMKTIDIMGSKISEESLDISDCVITVPTDGTGLLETEKLDLCYKAGYDIIIKNIKKIKEIIE